MEIAENMVVDADAITTVATNILDEIKHNRDYGVEIIHGVKVAYTIYDDSVIINYMYIDMPERGKGLLSKMYQELSDRGYKHVLLEPSSQWHRDNNVGYGIVTIHHCDLFDVLSERISLKEFDDYLYKNSSTFFKTNTRTGVLLLRALVHDA